MKQDWIFMPHAGHFICGSRCQFRLNTYIPNSKVIVSTVGELKYSEGEEFQNVGCDRKYETMVFHAKKGKNKCCPFEQEDGKELDFDMYNDPDRATVGHYNLCKKWDRKKS
jgi:hypothetical protein